MNKEEMDMKKALVTIMQVLKEHNTCAFDAECSLDTGIIATLHIELVDIKDMSKNKLDKI
jgi:hypothetical protein